MTLIKELDWTEPGQAQVASLTIQSIRLAHAPYFWYWRLPWQWQAHRQLLCDHLLQQYAEVCSSPAEHWRTWSSVRGESRQWRSQRCWSIYHIANLAYVSLYQCIFLSTSIWWITSQKSIIFTIPWWNNIRNFSSRCDHRDVMIQDK